MENSQTEVLLKKADIVISKMCDLLEKSEERIDRTNKMISELSDVIQGLKDAYVHHIDQAVDNNKLLTQQNTELIKQMNLSQTLIKAEQERCDKMLESLICMICHAPTVNINQ